MGVMVRFESPYAKDGEPVTLGPFQVARISDGCLYGDDEEPIEKICSIALGYFDREQCAWVHDDKLYDDVKIFAASSVVPA